MKFNNYDELIDFLKDKELSSLEFTVTGADGEDITPVEGDCDGPCAIAPTVAPVEVVENVDVQIKSLYDSPTMQFKKGSSNILVVETLNHIPNTCSTSEIKIGDRTILTSICEDENGIPSIDLFVSCDGKSEKKKFSLYTKDSGLENQISLND